MGGHSLGWVDGKAALDKFASGQGDTTPVFNGDERVISGENGLHFL